MRENERTLKMKQEFMVLHKEGLGIPAIAKKFDLSVDTVRRHLPEIAKRYGVTRESLLERPHKPHLTYERQFEPVAEVNIDLYRKKFKELEKAGRELSNLMSEYINGQEEG